MHWSLKNVKKHFTRLFSYLSIHCAGKDFLIKFIEKIVEISEILKKESENLKSSNLEHYFIYFRFSDLFGGFYSVKSITLDSINILGF